MVGQITLVWSPTNQRRKKKTILRLTLSRTVQENCESILLAAKERLGERLRLRQVERQSNTCARMEPIRLATSRDSCRDQDVRATMRMRFERCNQSRASSPSWF